MTGTTPPLRLTFASPRIVYPMRLSKGAKNPQTVTVYVAAPYRVDASKLPDADVKPELLYAGRVDRETDPQLAAPTSFLTAYSATYQEPGRITDDFAFTQAANDDEFQRVRYVTENDGAVDHDRPAVRRATADRGRCSTGRPPDGEAYVSAIFRTCGQNQPGRLQPCGCLDQ